MNKNKNEWTTVRRTKSRRRKPRDAKSSVPSDAMPHRADGKSLQHEARQDSEVKAAKMKEMLDARKESIQASEWWDKTSQQLNAAINGRRVIALHCLGLGSFENCAATYYQFECLLLIKESFGNQAKCTIADPVMEEFDREVACGFGFQLVETTDVVYGPDAIPHIVEVSRPQSGECVLWFMPHCPRALYEVVLGKCGKFGFEGMVFFANKLSDYADREGQEDNCPILKELYQGKRLNERDCPDPTLSSWEFAFNDLSIITIADTPR